ncbi:DoxX family protein [Xanthocytophaga agilis]|uniref:DoxX family protein n=1 Tax=Xanthocytophaga agilis TaxID=3048010 RepID=A0AAE3R243_9BACT|nr:DoxX family protein [Xanthocytophaga agilis]MDJ1501695.1 hypothetical protein [Xanthocytophaga agilis]
MAVSIFLHVRHGWTALHFGNDPDQVKMMTELGVNKTYVPVIGVILLILAVLILLPQTFFIGNLLNAFSILIIMALALNANNVRMALIEIPFLALPLGLIWLKYPFQFTK